MKNKIITVIVFSLFMLVGFSKSTFEISADEGYDLPSVVEVYQGEEEEISPYALYTAAQISVWLIGVCIQHCASITNFVNAHYAKGGLGNFALGKNLWLRYSNYSVTTDMKTPKSKNTSWNAPNSCIWTGPNEFQGNWYCMYGLE